MKVAEVVRDCERLRVIDAHEARSSAAVRDIDTVAGRTAATGHMACHEEGIRVFDERACSFRQCLKILDDTRRTIPGLDKTH